jgi:cyclophilin family peptidyl-prolyl cis-trans isomerase
MKWVRLLFLVAVLACSQKSQAGTLAMFETSLGTMNLDLYDGDKPVTVQNFIRYVRSGRYTNMIVQRWEPRFVIQGGGYYVEKLTDSTTFRTIPTFGNITNEYSVGKTYSNVYGTIAMARQPGVVNSASGQWFLNLTNNAFLDSVDEGFTVFGKVITGTNVLNQFYPPPGGTNPLVQAFVLNTNKYGEVIYMNTLPARGPKYDDLIYINVRFIECSFTRESNGDRVIRWNAYSGVTNRLQISTNLPPVWKALTERTGGRGTMSVTNGMPPSKIELYRVEVELGSNI